MAGKCTHFKKEPDDIGILHIKLKRVFLLKLRIPSMPSLDMQERLNQKRRLGPLCWKFNSTMCASMKQSGSIMPLAIHVPCVGHTVLERTELRREPNVPRWYGSTGLSASVQLLAGLTSDDIGLQCVCNGR